ncbi:MAG: Wzz/FepE/Etk N-terminal domain-containing protein [Clostridia bacterium]|nr:Wzz/FepE/Etk N-terminal domain-containing protein [Clostridia bacterium]
MNIDENVRKILVSLLRKWKVIVAFALVGALLGFFYTANFTQLTYTSTVEFLAYAVDTKSEIKGTYTSPDDTRTSNTSKMNYTTMMLDTYIEIMNTNEFASTVAQELNNRINSSCTGTNIKNAITVEAVEGTAMFVITVTTASNDLSYEIAHQLETEVPNMMKHTNNGLVMASVEDKPIKASAAGSKGYPKKCIIGAVAGIIVACAYIILRNPLDIRIRTSEELVEKYSIPVLGSIPNYEIKSVATTSHAKAIDEPYVSTPEKGDEE